MPCRPRRAQPRSGRRGGGATRPVSDASKTRLPPSLQASAPGPLRGRAIERHGTTAIIATGGSDRLPLVEATLRALRECAGVGRIVVVEADGTPHARRAVEARGAEYLFLSANRDEFPKARALNAGLPFVDTPTFLWLDDDILVPPAFLARAVQELEQRRLDCLVAWSEIHYLSAADSALCRTGAEPSTMRPVRRLRVGSASGGAVLVRTEFARRAGGGFEGFLGWGGEDDAWLHKAGVLGRAGRTRRSDQRLHHLYHPSSSGYGAIGRRARGPIYERNVALLGAVRSVRSAPSPVSRPLRTTPSPGRRG